MNFPYWKWTVIGNAFWLILAPWPARAVSPEDVPCCSSITLQQFINTARQRITRLENDQKRAQTAFQQCESNTNNALATCLPTAQPRYDQCMQEQDRVVTRFCGTFGDRLDACNAMTNAAAKQECLSELAQKYGSRINSRTECREKFMNYTIAMGRALDQGNPCDKERDYTCPPVETTCHPERANLNRIAYQLSEMRTGLHKLEQMLSSGSGACVLSQTVTLENENLCDRPTLASYSCARNGAMECVFTQCVSGAPATSTLRISIAGKDIASSGLKGAPNNYHTDYTVEYKARAAKIELKWQGAVRVDGPRSWYGYNCKADTDVPLGRYCLANNKRDYLLQAAQAVPCK